MKTKGIDVVSFIKPKCVDGTNISFWNDAWRGDVAFKILAPRIYMLESMKDIQGSGEFSVSSIWKTINAAFLPCGNVKTRWVRQVPIKINILSWKVSNDYLPTRFNLSSRGYQEINSYEEWTDWMLSIRLPYNRKRVFEGICYIVWWFIWDWRNQAIFGLGFRVKSMMFDDIVFRLLKLLRHLRRLTQRADSQRRASIMEIMRQRVAECMRTRSSSNLVGETSKNPNPKGCNRRRSKQRVEPFSLEEIPIVTMVDQHTMAELLRAPTEGYAEAIVVPPIPAEHFVLKHRLINLVTSKQFFGFEKEDPYTHIRYFNKITSTLKYTDVPESSIKLMLFLFSVDGPARIWLDKEPSRSILTWDDLSKVHNSRNKPIVSQVKASNVNSSEIASVVASSVTSAMTAMFKQHQVTPASAFVKAVEESCVTYGGAHSYRQCHATNDNTFSGYQDNIQGYVSAAAVNYNQGNTGCHPQSVANQFWPPGFAQPSVQNQGFNQNRGNNFNQGNTSYQAPIQQTQVATSSDLEKFKKINEASMQAMRNHISNLKSELRSEMQPLPSNIIANPKGELKAITTRSRVSYEGPPIPPQFSSLRKVVEWEPDVTKDTLKPTMTYPSRMNKQKLRKKDDKLALKFLEIFRKLHFDLSFTDALLHMPKFATMFKSLLNNKEKLFDLATTPLNENCSAVILKKLPEKLGDPGKFLIPCDFPELVECLALADLGASINLMPLLIWEKLSLPELTPTQMILELADRSTTQPAGIAEDIFVRVGKFYFPTEFVGVDYVVDPRVPLILGRPFLRTERDLIDVYGEELTLRVDDKAITFKVGQTSKYSYNDAELINRIDVIDVACKSIPPGIDYTDFDEGDILLLEKLLNDDPSSPLPPKELYLEELKIVKSFIIDPSGLELKDLPSHL
nr:reverse transcriptase domain-containing protein [Tanacetum cinerariifolium]